MGRFRMVSGVPAVTDGAQRYWPVVSLSLRRAFTVASLVRNTARLRYGERSA